MAKSKLQSNWACVSFQKPKTSKDLLIVRVREDLGARASVTWFRTLDFKFGKQKPGLIFHYVYGPVCGSRRLAREEKEAAIKELKLTKIGKTQHHARQAPVDEISPIIQNLTREYQPYYQFNQDQLNQGWNYYQWRWDQPHQYTWAQEAPLASYIYPASDETYNFAIGYTQANNNIAIGYTAQTNNDSIAIGSNSLTAANNSIAVGYMAQASNDNNIVIGNNSYVSSMN